MIVFIVLLTALINRDDTGSGLSMRLVPNPVPAQPAPGYTRIAGAFGPRPGR
jgi:hypothetical protein